MARPISQISGLEKPERASETAPLELSGLVTPVSATTVMAMIARAPMRMVLPMMAAMVATKIASRCQASGLTPSGTGITNQSASPRVTETRAGSGLNASISELLWGRSSDHLSTERIRRCCAHLRIDEATSE